MRFPRLLRRALLAIALVAVVANNALAAEVMCDPSFQDCRAILLSRIQNETQAIDLAMLFMEDDGLADAIIARHQAGVRVRVLMEPRRNTTTPKNEVILERLKTAGIPMRAKAGGGMLHWKFMIFDAQNVVQWSAANYSDFYFKPIVPYANYTDEGIFFTDQPSLVDSFRRKFDDAWVDPAAFTHFANITTAPARRYPLYGIDPELSFVPFENFATRSVPLYDAEQVRIDTVMYKITDAYHTDGIIRAAQRGVPVRLIVEGERYRNPANIWQAYQVDRLYMAGVQIRDRAHEGFLHQKSTLLYGQATTIFGSSNWTNESNLSQYEHNYFTTKTWFFNWFRENFERKWSNQTGNIETVPFRPLPPDAPAYASPANAATGVATTGTVLRWNPGPWGWTADIYFGTSPTPPLLKANASASPNEVHSFALPALTAGTTYYWKIVSKTLAQQQAEGPVYSFTTAGGTPPPPPPNVLPTVSLTSPSNNSTFTAPATIAIAATAGDSDGAVVRVEFYAGGTFIGADTTAPYQFSWGSVPAGVYSLTARATDNSGATTTSSSIAVTVSAPAPAPTLPAPWQSQDIGAVGPAGRASATNGTFSVSGGGADVWGSADALHFAWQRLSGDADVIARVTSVEYVHAWVKAGVMIRERLTADSAHAFMMVTPGKGLAFQRRVAHAGLSTHTSGGLGTAPSWVKLERRGATITAFQSANGTTWTVVGSDTFAMPADIHVGLGVSSHDSTRLATATFDSVTVRPVTSSPPPNAPPTVSIVTPSNNSSFTAPATIAIGATAADNDGSVVRVDFYSGAALLGSDATAPYQFSWSNVASGSYALTARATDDRGGTATSGSIAVTVSAQPPPPPPALPDAWKAQDVGAVGPAGSASAANGTFTVQGAGADVWGTADAFHYVWQPISGDVDIVARVASVEYVHAWTKAGVMIRERLTADAAQAFMLVSPGRGIAFQRRIAPGGLSTSTAGAFVAAPAWLKLERRAGTISAFQSTDGVNWTFVGQDTFTMAASAYLGLAVSSHDATRLASATFDSVRVQPATAPAPPPSNLKEIVLYAADATAIAGTWRLETDSTAAAGTRAWIPDMGIPKVTTPAADPASYVEFTFNAEAGRPYRLWMRGKAERDEWSNDSAHVQFSGSVDAQGAPAYRIGTTASTTFLLESCTGCGVAGWGWEDNGWGAGVLGPVIYFATTGTQRIRVQNREDGLSFDQIVLSAERYLNAAPGAGKFDTTIVQKN
jgi:regulation of enolase protein 1 (concanavalin A-like superfamily)